MKFTELQTEVDKYIYTEDDGMYRVAIAATIATRMKLGDPVWLLIIGPSSSGKSQVLRPLALTDSKFIHRVDDLTENTLLSGIRVKEGGPNVSLLKRIGSMGIIVISDFTVLFSKSAESRAAVLSQLRMVYDGEMIKYSGTSDKPISWKGYLGILAGSTPSVYGHFEEVADMGERFVYYRMKAYDVEKATRRSLSRSVFGKELDEKLSNLYAEYIKDCVTQETVPEISLEVYDRIVRISMLAAQLRTPIHYDRFQKVVDKIPVSEMPMRIAQQLCALARGLSVMSKNDTDSWELSEKDIQHIEWCAYSLANEERRACLRAIAGFDHDAYISTQIIADKIGLSTSVVGLNLQHLAAIGILARTGTANGLAWQIAQQEVWELVRRFEAIEESSVVEDRQSSLEEGDDEEAKEQEFMEF